MTTDVTTDAGTDPEADRIRSLVRPDAVHGSLYTDPAVYARELERIWYTTWVYVGHTSEVPEADDYVRKTIGPQQVVMTRDKTGAIHVLHNRCSHRGNLVCDADRGNAGSFRCPYHGWTFANTGDLLGFPFNQGYGGSSARDRLPGLAAAPRVEVYRGFVFASLAAEGPTLREHLGPAAERLDRLCALSPAGEVELTAGWVRHEVTANWKMLVENETDGYHPQFVHSSIFSISGSGIGALYSDKSTAVTRALGGGHTENDLSPEFRRLGVPMGWAGTPETKIPDYVAAMRAAHGTGKADEIMIDGSPHVMIFPNLFVAEIQLFQIQPIAVDRTVQHVTAIQFKDAPDLNRRLVTQCVGSVGPAGMLLADDAEMYERNQRGVAARHPEWLDLSRGLQRERVDDDGFTIGTATDETSMRAMWAHYLELMA
ncbi:ring-hydroxylating oxygenase subunit alpha [Actinomycetospora sp. NBRC 106375]|uniref:aromatic ring-hydroxylating oxygenase subunit alpha n=1 Tax=Actinomycetospora sp. NBRC 106375 TaxID=3032207 RepID=UPI0024A36B03|nr:aromatic ring-hydroxylating dioxygenase subunit alpha [Actinomycetospora sp. NBRC 106375]GLZ49697.1 ring-hydroxylating oxygenase subunit alpha [Actinomycetospora sp. NBRC 106375]